MAKKKSRKGRARKAPKMYPKGAPTSTASVKAGRPKQPVDEPSASTTRATATGKELREEYWYVYNDLKRIAMVAGMLLAVLIVLSFFIR